jgi:hypothetical protein
MNIFMQETAHFLRRLQFSFLVGGGCAMFQILTRFSDFQLKSSFICLMEGLYMSYINHSKYLGDQFKSRMALERSISGYVAVLFQISGVQFFRMKQRKF